MPENNQVSDAAKPEAAGSSSTQPNSLAIDMSHADAIVPHKISNHDKLVQTMVMVDGEWINVNDANDQKNVQKDMHKVNRVVTEAQKGIVEAKSTADSAVAYADSAVSASKVNSDAIAAQSSAISAAKAATDSAMSRANSAWDVANGAKSAVTDFDPLLKSAQSDVGKALNQIADTASDLASAKAAFSSDVASAKGLASAAQTTADNAVKSASSVAGDLTAVASQAKSNASGITKVTSDVGLLQTTVADNSGNISKIQETATKIQQAVSDNAGNITTTKQTADSAVTVASDARSNATVAIQTASQASITANNASGQAASAVLTANGALTTASNAKSDATVAIQTASGASLTATNANSDATIAKQTASEATVQASNAESNFAQLSIRANKIEANVATNSGAIASVQQTANGLTTTVADIKANGGGVNLLQGTRDFSGISIRGNKVAVTNGAETFQAAVGTPNSSQPNFDLVAFNPTSVEKDTDYTASFWVKTSEDTDIYSYLFDSGSNGVYFDGETVSHSTTDYTRIVVRFHNGNNSTTPIFIPARLVNKEGVTISVYGCMFEKGTVAHDWSPAPDDLQNQFTQTKESIDGITTTINDPKTGLNATYQTAAGNATTISSVKGDVTQLQTTANGLTSRVGSLESKTNTQQTAIEQNKKDITLKADQTTVNTLEGTVSQNSATLKTQANEISSKVTRSDVTGMLNGYATTSTVQSLITQNAGTINENITNLDVEIKNNNGGGINLLNATDFSSTDLTKLKDVWGSNFTLRDGCAMQLDNLKGNSDLDVAQFIPVEPDTDYTLSFETYYNTVASGGSYNNIYTFIVEYKDQNNTTLTYLDHKRVVANTADKSDNIQTVHTQKDCHYVLVIFRASAETLFSFWRSKLERGSVATPWSPAPSDLATVTQIQQVTATVDGIKSTVATKADQSTVTQLSNALQSKVESSTYTSAISQLSSDINLRVKSADLISQINMEAGNTLIQSNKIYLDAKSVVFGQNSEAFIPAALITNLTADYIKTGVLDASNLQVKNFNADAINAGKLSGIDIQSADKDGNKYEMIGPNLYWFSPHSKARIGQAHKDDNELDMFFMDTAHKKIIGSEDFYSIIGAPDVAIASAGDWGEQGKDAINSPNYYPKFYLKGWTSEEAPETDEYAGAGAYLTSGGTTLTLRGDFSPAFNGEQSYGTSFENQADDSLYVNGWHGFTFNLNHLNDGTHPSDWQKNAAFTIQKDNRMTASFGSGDDGNTVALTTAGSNNRIAFNTSNFDIDGEVNIKNNHGLSAKNVHVTGWLGVDGSKNSIVRTSQGTVAINAYETAEYYFGDLGEGQTDSNGVAYIGIEKLFNETVNTNIPYQVFLTAYGPGNLWVAQREHDRFIVKSDQPNIKFGWEIKAKRKGYEHTRLQNVDDKLNHMEATS